MASVRCLLVVLAVIAVETAVCGQAVPSGEPGGVPPDCDKPALLVLGRPHMITGAQSPRLGLSMNSASFLAGKPVMLYIWADNPTGEAVQLFTCSDLESFKQRGFDVYDAKGRLLVRTKETEVNGKSRRKVDPCADFPWSCERNLMLTLEPHSCINGANFDFSTDLAEQYNLRPGTYTIHPHKSGSRSDTSCEQSRADFRMNPSTDITFSIVAP